MTDTAGYVKVQKDIRQLIIQGVYNSGDLLPSENELSSQYGLTRMTIRNALKNLEVEGLIYRLKGKGSIVKSKRKSIELLSIKGFTEVMKDKDLIINTLFLKKPIIKSWNDDFYWEISNAERMAGCIYMKRIRKIQNKPIMVEKTYFSNMNLPRFCATPFVNDSLFDTLIVKHDIEMTTVIQKFRAIPVSEELSEGLNITGGTPVLEIIRKLSTNRPGFYVYSFSYCNTSDFTIEA